MADSNPDLYWDLSSIKNKQQAADFFSKVASAFCVYSPTVEKIYSNFEVILPRKSDDNLVVLPDPYAFHDMFHFISNDSIKKTGIMLHPGDSVGNHGLYLSLPMKGSKRSKPIEFEKGMEMINKAYAKRDGDDQFLPLLLNGDLREFKADCPYLHLHRLEADVLTSLSAFERQDIKDSIGNRFKGIHDIYL